MNEEVLVYVDFLYKEGDFYNYNLYFSKTPDIVWGQDWDINCPLSNFDSTPDKTTYDCIYRIKSPYELKTLQTTTCYPMEYAIYGIMALSWINLENLDEYPENGRMVLHFNDTFKKVEEILSKFEINLIDVNKGY